MNNQLPFISLSMILMMTLFSGCQTAPTGLSISGVLTGISDTDVHLDQSKTNDTYASVTTGTCDKNGQFSMSHETHPGPGIYRLRAGGANTLLVLNGDEKKITLEGAPNDIARGSYKIEGAPLTQELLGIAEEQRTGQLKQNNLDARLAATSDPYVALAYAQLALRGRPDFTPVYQKIAQRLKTSYPNEDWGALDRMISVMHQKYQSQQLSQKIKLGLPAPDIVMPDINGKPRKLSDLKGKVVLLDFWASWCGPCRRANPHVVEMYHKYKDKGFDVFSVSLDGLDQSSIKRYKLSEDRIADQKQSSKDRWLAAIKKDKLTWDNHVSDLNKWDTESARTYGVRSIPRTFLIDREGTIVAINPRSNLEEMIQKNI